jgi:predicted N-acyltransferase
MTNEIKVYRSIAEIDRAKWDAIVKPASIFDSHDYVKALEDSGLNKGNCYYVVVYNGGEMTAHACAYVMKNPLDLFARGPLKAAVDSIRKRRPDFFTIRSLEVGPPIALGSAISLKEGPDKAETLKSLVDGIEGLAKQLGIKLVILRDFYDDERPFFDSLMARGYRNAHNLPRAHIKLRWKNFDEYVGAMRCSYRQKVTSNMRKFAKSQATMKVVKGFAGMSAELKKLYDNVYDHVDEYKRERLSEAFFRNIDTYLSGKSAIITIEKDSRLVGFMLVAFAGSTVISKLVGIDYTVNQECATYFNLFYKTLEIAMDMGMTDADMGITTLEPKKDMGSEILTLNMYVKHSNPLLNKALPVAFDLITPPDTTGTRNVFKPA